MTELDAPPDGRLLDEAARLQARAAAREPGLAGARIAAIGLATVDLDRAATAWTAADGSRWNELERDALLGARVLVRQSAGGRGPGEAASSAQPRVLLLEPDTEGRLAGTLARFGEGLAAIYLESTGGASGPPTAPPPGSVGRGPLGPERLVPGGPPWGPHVIVLGLTSARGGRPRRGACGRRASAAG